MPVLIKFKELYIIELNNNPVYGMHVMHHTNNIKSLNAIDKFLTHCGGGGTRNWAGPTILGPKLQYFDPQARVSRIDSVCFGLSAEPNMNKADYHN